ncbi:MAG: hypothetical protein K8T10_16060 [Candidatus Eremiobacteraeota bacterium]|nr:hypothetical protein [Candidatus Eremiobacteraeota bacterium]
MNNEENDQNMLKREDITDWQGFLDALKKRATLGTKRTWEFLDPTARAIINSYNLGLTMKPGSQDRIVESLNIIISSDKEFCSPELLENLQIPKDTQIDIQAALDATDPKELRKSNRLLLKKIFKGLMREVQSKRGEMEEIEETRSWESRQTGADKEESAKKPGIWARLKGKFVPKNERKEMEGVSGEESPPSHRKIVIGIVSGVIVLLIIAFCLTYFFRSGNKVSKAPITTQKPKVTTTQSPVRMYKKYRQRDFLLSKEEIRWPNLCGTLNKNQELPPENQSKAKKRIWESLNWDAKDAISEWNKTKNPNGPDDDAKKFIILSLNFLIKDKDRNFYDSGIFDMNKIIIEQKDKEIAKIDRNELKDWQVAYLNRRILEGTFPQVIKSVAPVEFAGVTVTPTPSPIGTPTQTPHPGNYAAGSTQIQNWHINLLIALAVIFIVLLGLVLYLLFLIHNKIFLEIWPKSELDKKALYGLVKDVKSDSRFIMEAFTGDSVRDGYKEFGKNTKGLVEKISQIKEIKSQLDEISKNNLQMEQAVSANFDNINRKIEWLNTTIGKYLDDKGIRYNKYVQENKIITTIKKNERDELEDAGGSALSRKILGERFISLIKAYNDGVRSNNDVHYFSISKACDELAETQLTGNRELESFRSGPILLSRIGEYWLLMLNPYDSKNRDFPQLEACFEVKFETKDKDKSPVSPSRIRIDKLGYCKEIKMPGGDKKRWEIVSKGKITIRNLTGASVTGYRDGEHEDPPKPDFQEQIKEEDFENTGVSARESDKAHSQETSPLKEIHREMHEQTEKPPVKEEFASYKSQEVVDQPSQFVDEDQYEYYGEERYEEEMEYSGEQVASEFEGEYEGEYKENQYTDYQQENQYMGDQIDEIPHQVRQEIFETSLQRKENEKLEIQGEPAFDKSDIQAKKNEYENQKSLLKRGKKKDTAASHGYRARRRPSANNYDHLKTKVRLDPLRVKEGAIVPPWNEKKQPEVPQQARFAYDGTPTGNFKPTPEQFDKDVEEEIKSVLQILNGSSPLEQRFSLLEPRFNSLVEATVILVPDPYKKPVLGPQEYAPFLVIKLGDKWFAFVNPRCAKKINKDTLKCCFDPSVELVKKFKMVTEISVSNLRIDRPALLKIAIDSPSTGDSKWWLNDRGSVSLRK